MKKFKFGVDNNVKLNYLKEALESNGCYDEFYTIDEQKKTIEFQYETERELFDVGVSYGYEQYREKPQEFYLPSECCDLLRQAISEWENDNHMTNASVEISKSDNAPAGHEAIHVSPTQITALFGMFSRYGKLLSNLKEA